MAGPGLSGLTVRACIRNKSWATAPLPAQPSPIYKAQEAGRDLNRTGPHMPGQLYPHPSPCHCGSGLEAAKGPAPSPCWLWAGGQSRQACCSQWGRNTEGSLAQGWGDLPRCQSCLCRAALGGGGSSCHPRLSQEHLTGPPTRTQHPKVLSDHTVSDDYDEQQTWVGAEPGMGIRPPQRARAERPSLSVEQSLVASHPSPVHSAPGQRPSDLLSPLAVRSPQHKRSGADPSPSETSPLKVPSSSFEVV